MNRRDRVANLETPLTIYKTDDSEIDLANYSPSHGFGSRRKSHAFKLARDGPGEVTTLSLTATSAF